MGSVRYSAFALALCMGAAHGAMAQQAAPTAGVAQLQEVVVTAQRKSENLQKVPIAVTAVSSAQLAAANIQNTQTLANVTPALTFSNVNGFLEPRVRGVGSAAAGASIENSVATYIDGVYISSATGSSVDLSNVARVEVLKGPQGTLFGRNATGGLVQIITKDPKDSFSGDADLGYGSFNTSHADLYITGPIVADKIAADLSLSASHQGDGYGKNTVNGEDINKTDRDLAARSKWLIRLTSGATIRITGDISQTDSSYPAVEALSGTSGVYVKTSAGVPVVLNHSPWDGQFNSTPAHNLVTGGLSARIDQQIGDLTLSSITAYRGVQFQQRFDADLSAAPAVQENFLQEDRQFSQEVQLSSPQHGRLQWVAGLYYFNLHSAFDPLTLITAPLSATPASTVLRDYLKTESEAIYGQATYEVFDATHFTAGFRYSGETRTIAGNNTTNTAAGAHVITPLPSKAFATETPTWRLSLDHQFTSQVLAYVSWNRGFKSGGFNPSAPTAPDFKPETLDAYETGIKSTFLDHRLRINAAAFDYEYKNIQVNTYLGSIGVTYNGAAARIYGLDLDFDFAVTEHLTLSGGADLLHDRFTNFDNAVVAYQTAIPGFAAIYPAANPTANPPVLGHSATGNRLPFSPDATVNFGFDYKTQIAGGRTDLVMNDLYNSGFFSQPDNFEHQGSYHMLDGSVTWHAPSDRYSLKIWADNITNVAVAEYLTVSSAGQAVSYQPPRTYGVSLGLKF